MVKGWNIRGNEIVHSKNSIKGQSTLLLNIGYWTNNKGEIAIAPINSIFLAPAPNANAGEVTKMAIPKNSITLVI
ncbi:hypothetical protein BACCELL_05627 [Bacteroides cellulosilyticus DSM 14838]|uniref:Uncharacterized protein n=1 Tax=Bacteroides cellulosilyticus DSM 14838 TaxID=537012 RepID=E2NMT1_9BACE|nr:hypothetical protein BACCELL_05627 [Bacteroides cellulosilyticus DSM 14838]